MKQPNVIFIDDKFKGIKVAYEPQGKLTTFKTSNNNIQVGSFVIVPTNTRWEMTICKVMEVNVPCDLSTAQEIIGVV